MLITESEGTSIAGGAVTTAGAEVVAVALTCFRDFILFRNFTCLYGSKDDVCKTSTNDWIILCIEW